MIKHFYPYHELVYQENITFTSAIWRWSKLNNFEFIVVHMIETSLSFFLQYINVVEYILLDTKLAS